MGHILRCDGPGKVVGYPAKRGGIPPSDCHRNDVIRPIDVSRFVCGVFPKGQFVMNSASKAKFGPSVEKNTLPVAALLFGMWKSYTASWVMWEITLAPGRYFRQDRTERR